MSDQRGRAMVCPKCRNTENHYGAWIFPNQKDPTCPNHVRRDRHGQKISEEIVPLVPAREDQ